MVYGVILIERINGFKEKFENGKLTSSVNNSLIKNDSF